ncbi:conserved membrane hypothetical protein [Paraburkholderia ribeironis]|uniref:Uncharacterized protein n=1 Tax=Paraburkholderia ribeironis TaxID=1247936 RepID=A0A1N7SFM0_9BURK|nr:patatin-like phospholipase family protein [Paraburkholderia ribeironis]SIT46195.1 conserved membrane hypothetical protein [Paraburkholderia ribeironis]
MKGDFSPALNLARSLCGHVYRRWLHPIFTLGQAERLYPALRENFSASMYKIGDQVYVGRGYPLSREEDVVEVVRHCNAQPAPELVERAVTQWRSVAAGQEITNNIPIVEQTAFDGFLYHNKLPAMAKEVSAWFSSLPAMPVGRFEHGLATPYRHLSHDLQVITLYLAYRVGEHHWPSLRQLLVELDWQQIVRLIARPTRVHELRMASVMQLSAVLKNPARAFIFEVLCSKPSVGHRALAQEYEHIVGDPTRFKSSNNIQDVMLAHGGTEGTGLTAICLSGGGIRSASFCLGALQVLGTYRIFGQFHYLSTVSGGGYIGTGLIRWMAAKVQDDGLTPREALAFAESELTRLRTADYVQDRMTGTDFDDEGPLTWLRMNSNYLARQLSLFSADAWTIVATYLRNLLIVWFIFWPWFAAFLLVPWFSVWLGRFGVASTPIPQWLAALGGKWSALVSYMGWTRPHWIDVLDSWWQNFMGLLGPDWPTRVGVLGAAIGVLGASYFYQGNLPGQTERRYANRIPVPKGGGNKRAAFGALLLTIASFCLSYAMWIDVDRSGSSFGTDSVLKYGYVFLAIAATQITLGFWNIDWRPRRFWASWWTMIFAAIFAGLTQMALIIWIRGGLAWWGPFQPDHPAVIPKAFNVASTVRSLITPALMLVALLIGESVKAAVRSYTEGPERREHQGRAHAFVFMFLCAWAVTAALVIAAPGLLTYYGDSVPTITAAGSALSLAVTTWLGYRKTSPGKPEAHTPVSFTMLGSVGMILLALLLSIGAWKVFEHEAPDKSLILPVRCECANLTAAQKQHPSDPAKAASGALDTPIESRFCSIPSAQCVDRSFEDYFDELLGQFEASALTTCLLILVATATFFFGLGFVIRMNEFSLHGFYRDRLIRAFYGGFRGLRKPRTPALFTGFDANDDLALGQIARLYRRSSHKYEVDVPTKPPFLVVNAALNLVKGTALAWQERKADSFTFTALSAGNYRIGYRAIARFAEGVKLGTAMAISGAAFNPNMGYNSSTPLAFLMSVFNVRLGWWLGNPKFDHWRHRDPSSSSWQMLQEAAGQTTDTDRWIHLSDGGHFDNMGLWEMVHRRCRRILVIDASQDGLFTMSDFYCTIRKIRIDMGIEISCEEDPVLLFPRSARAAGKCHARFRIRYSRMNGGDADENKDGIILYIKPCFYGSEPPDIQEYAEKHSDFPHESTADQFFNESQFESYRKLGEWEMLQVLTEVLRPTDQHPITAPVPIHRLFATPPG